MIIQHSQYQHSQTESDVFGRWTEAMLSGARAISAQQDKSAIKYFWSALNIALERNSCAKTEIFSVWHIVETAERMIDLMISVQQFNQAINVLTEIQAVAKLVDSVRCTEFLGRQYEKLEVAERMCFFEPNFFEPN